MDGRDNVTAYPPVALSDLDAVDQREVLMLSRADLHEDTRIILPSSAHVVSGDDIRIIVCPHPHNRHQQIGPDTWRCNQCGKQDL
jgi:hypothetical protein